MIPERICPLCKRPVDLGGHTRLARTGVLDEHGAPFVQESWRCDSAPKETDRLRRDEGDEC